MVKIVIPDEQKFLMINDQCYGDAVDLAISLVKRLHPENDEFHPLDCTRGVISQISNMVAGI